MSRLHTRRQVISDPTRSELSRAILEGDLLIIELDTDSADEMKVFVKWSRSVDPREAEAIAVGVSRLDHRNRRSVCAAASHQRGRFTSLDECGGFADRSRPQRNTIVKRRRRDLQAPGLLLRVREERDSLASNPHPPRSHLARSTRYGVASPAARSSHALNQHRRSRPGDLERLPAFQRQGRGCSYRGSGARDPTGEGRAIALGRRGRPRLLLHVGA
jgi:hypothetical protein